MASQHEAVSGLTPPAQPAAAEGMAAPAAGGGQQDDQGKTYDFVPYSPPVKVKKGGGKKPRPFTSCVSCRRRKIKCLNERIPCKPCLEYGEICSLLASEEAQNYQPPPPEVLKDQGIKVKRRRKSSTSRRLAKANSDPAAPGSGNGLQPTAGPSTQPSAEAGPSRLGLLDPPPSALPSSSIMSSTSPPPLAPRYGDGRPLSISTARPSYVLAPSSSSTLGPPSHTQPRLSPMLNNSLGSLPIRRDSLSTSPASVTTSLKRPHDWDYPTQGQSLSASSPSFPLPSPGNFTLPSPSYAPPTPAPKTTQDCPAPGKSLDFLLTPWSPTNDAIGPGSIRPRPIEPLPALSERSSPGGGQGGGDRLRGDGGLARPPELESVVEESPENANQLHSPDVAPPPPVPVPPAKAKSEPLSTPATTTGSQRYPGLQSPAVALSNGGGGGAQTEAGVSYATSHGSLTSPYQSNPALPQELLGTLIEPSSDQRTALQSAFKTALGWLFPWCDPAQLGRSSKGGLWAFWSLGMRVSEFDSQVKGDLARSYLARAKELAGLSAISSEPSIEHLETVILIAWADYGLAETPKATWNWCGIGIKLAEGLGLYESSPAFVSPRLTVVLQSLYQLDKILSIRLHRPPSFPLSSPLSKFIPRPVSHPTCSFEAITTLCAFIGQVAYGEHMVKVGLMAEKEARDRSDQVLQDLESWLTDLKAKDGYLTRKDEAEARGRVWIELWLQGIFILLNSPRLLNPQALPWDTLIDVARSSASAVSTLVQTYSSFSPSILISPYLDVPVSFALSTIESDIEGMTSPAGGLAGLGQGIVKDQRLEESRALREWLREAGSVWGF